jgi:NAD(P)-dependent dehydrogenase (short-subunit alcohol dehydrogenase family)
MKPSESSGEAAVSPTELSHMPATKRASIRLWGRLVGQAAALAGPVDILINNAGTLDPVPLRLIPDTDREDFERALQVNTIGLFQLIKTVVRSVILRQTGVIVNISSDASPNKEDLTQRRNSEPLCVFNSNSFLLSPPDPYRIIC